MLISHTYIHNKLPCTIALLHMNNCSSCLSLPMTLHTQFYYHTTTFTSSSEREISYCNNYMFTWLLLHISIINYIAIHRWFHTNIHFWLSVTFYFTFFANTVYFFSKYRTHVNAKLSRAFIAAASLQSKMSVIARCIALQTCRTHVSRSSIVKFHNVHSTQVYCVVVCSHPTTTTTTVYIVTLLFCVTSPLAFHQNTNKTNEKI